MNFKESLNHVRCFMFDMDGVLTDGTLLVMPEEFHRTMYIRDGYAMKQAIDAGYIIAVISGGKSASAQTRFNKLGVTEVFLGVEDKLEVMKDIMSRHELKKEEVLFMGDDLPDYEVMQHAGIPCCPADAAHEIKELSVYISSYNGGKGCVRDVIEQAMRLQGRWKLSN